MAPMRGSRTVETIHESLSRGLEFTALSNEGNQRRFTSSVKVRMAGMPGSRPWMLLTGGTFSCESGGLPLVQTNADRAPTRSPTASRQASGTPCLTLVGRTGLLGLFGLGHGAIG